MPTSLPPSVREHFGEDVAEDFARWLDEAFEQRTVERDEYREVLSRLDVLEERFVQLEQRIDERFEQVDKRFEQVDQRFEQVDERFEQINQRFEQQTVHFNDRFEQQTAQFNDRIDTVNERFDALNERIDRLHEAMRVQTRWTIGTIALFGTIVTVLLAIAEFGG